MGLLTRLRGPRVHDTGPIAWRPISAEIFDAPPERMGDDGCAGTAYGTDWQLNGGNPAAILTVWVYPVHAEQEGRFELGRMYEHFAYREGEPWEHRTWEREPGSDVLYRDVPAAERGAKAAAAELARLTVPRTDRDVFGFDWDSEPC